MVGDSGGVRQICDHHVCRVGTEFIQRDNAVNNNHRFATAGVTERTSPNCGARRVSSLLSNSDPNVSSVGPGRSIVFSAWFIVWQN